jgi:hypothetical protein
MLLRVDLEEWLRERCAEYSFEVQGVFDARGDHQWPLVAKDHDDLIRQLAEGGHVLPLPKEPAALANILEVSIVDFLLMALSGVGGTVGTRGTERGYPDLEVTGEAFGGGFHAVDIKAARRKPTKRGVSKNTQSRITLYTGNTYFRYPQLHWPGTPRPFNDYSTHLDVIGIYTLDEDAPGRVTDLELIVQQPWKIGSKQRSSTTREYIGAVVDIDDLRTGRGEFDTPEAFYAYWRKYPFKIGRVVQQQLDKLLRNQ